jgi:hypothetical protein
MWYSVSLRRGCIVGTDGITSLWDSIFLVSASDRDSAWTEAMRIGKGLETSYDNAEGERIRFAFLGVLTIDQLGAELRSGLEVYFTSLDLLQPIPVSPDTDFFPKRIVPGQAGIGTEMPT